MQGVFPYRRHADQDRAEPARHPVVVVGAGPVGLTAAIDLALRSVPVVLLDEDDRLATGSRAICFAQRTLEIWDRLGLGQRMVDKGVVWNTGRVFYRDQPLYQFDLRQQAGHRRPAFINLQQYYVEAFLVERARDLPAIDLRWKNRVTDLAHAKHSVQLTIETPDGPYVLDAAWVIAADGARSPLRRMMGLESKGQSFRDRFLIADVRMQAPFPAERWFWFDPPFHPGQSVLLHQQPDDLWRIDFQLGWDADSEREREPERILPRVRALLGPHIPFELEWASIYTFACLRMERFRHGRVFFAGDAAHGVSPFGARGANGGVQDADNLAWKLAAVLADRAPAALLDSYDTERIPAADENILNATRSTDFLTPKSAVSRVFRDAVLDLARGCAFARALVNSGRLSLPHRYAASALITPDADDFVTSLAPGSPAADAPVADGWLLARLPADFSLLYFTDRGPPPEAGIPVLTLPARGIAAERYGATDGTAYLLRPDHHIAARWRRFEPEKLRHALARSLGRRSAREDAHA